MYTQRHRGAKSLAQGHAARKWGETGFESGVYTFFFSYFHLFIFALGIDCYSGFSLVAEWRLLCLGGQTSRGGAQDFGSRTAGSVVVSYGLHCSEAGGIFPDRIEPMSPALDGGFFTTKPPGSTLLITILPAS